MKYLKMLGLTASAAVALIAVAGAGTASATALTCGATHCPVGTVFEAENESHVAFHLPFGSVTCKTSAIAGTTTSTGGAAETVKSHITHLSFSDHEGKTCNNGAAVVTVLQKGTLEIHTEFETTGETSHQKAASTNNGTLTSNGTEITFVYLGFHCIYRTTNTDIGTVTGSSVTGSHATIDLVATLPRHGGTSGAFCGEKAQWTGSYKITKPNPLNVH